MAWTVKLELVSDDLSASIRGVLDSILRLEDISAVLALRQLPMKPMFMPSLVTRPEDLEGVDPLAPAYPLNAARLVSRISRRPSGGRIAVVLRPCEIRAVVELVKLKQARTDELVIIGIDCLGALRNADFARTVGGDAKEASCRFVENRLSGQSEAELAPACRVCEHPTPVGADIAVSLFGRRAGDPIHLMGQSAVGEALLRKIGLLEDTLPENRRTAVADLTAARREARDRMFEKTRAATDSLEKLTAYLAGCVNCYNCRVACPVCYCRECVFLTDVFDHEPARYLRWAKRKGVIKMPTDTVFYHLTRLTHMSTACIGCGQCSNACPNDIPVMELFRTIAFETQAAFDYEPGRDVDEAPPLTVFQEKEFSEVVGISE